MSMNLTKEMKAKLAERINFQRCVEILLDIRPKMEVARTGNKTKGYFDLRSLNAEVVKK